MSKMINFLKLVLSLLFNTLELYFIMYFTQEMLIFIYFNYEFINMIICILFYSKGDPYIIIFMFWLFIKLALLIIFFIIYLKVKTMFYLLLKMLIIMKEFIFNSMFKTNFNDLGWTWVIEKIFVFKCSPDYYMLDLEEVIKSFMSNHEIISQFGGYLDYIFDASLILTPIKYVLLYTYFIFNLVKSGIVSVAYLFNFDWIDKKIKGSKKFSIWFYLWWSVSMLIFVMFPVSILISSDGMKHLFSLIIFLIELFFGEMKSESKATIIFNYLEEFKKSEPTAEDTFDQYYEDELFYILFLLMLLLLFFINFCVFKYFSSKAGGKDKTKSTHFSYFFNNNYNHKYYLSLNNSLTDNTNLIKSSKSFKEFLSGKTSK